MMDKFQPKWKSLQPYCIGVVATMSAGKSTLLNALIGKELLHTANEATTAKITTIFHHNYAKSAYGSVKLRNGDVLKDNHLSEQKLRDWNANKEVHTVHLHLKLNKLRATKKHYPVLFDTPGPNNSQDDVHAKLTYAFMKYKQLDLLIYILNGTQIGINDDQYFLQKIQEIRKKQIWSTPIVFVLNKIDELDPEKGETVEKMVQNCRQYLENLGFKQPEILPVSAQKALLALKWLSSEPLRRHERSMLKKYLYDYASEREVEQIMAEYPQHQKIALQMVVSSGIVALEQHIQAKLKEKTMSMSISIQIKHNPFLVETEIMIDGQKPAENSALSQYRKQRFQLWIDHLFHDLQDMFNGETAYSVEFHGVESDCNDMTFAVTQANEQGFNIQLNCTQADNGEVRLQKIQEIMQQMETDELFRPYIESNADVREKFQAAFNRDFDVYVVATMSSGKSTLINSLMGCSMLPALNEATTATIACITDNDQAPQGYFTAQCLNKQGDVLDERDDLVFADKESAEKSLGVLSDWNKQKDTFRIDITGNIIGIRERDNVRLVLSDTPGPNNSQDEDHALSTMQHIADSDRNPLILYVLNAQQMGINDDRTLLLQIADVMKKAGKQNRDRFIFVLNKADVFDPEKGEHIEGVVERAKQYLRNNGIESPMVYPVSAQLALLLRKSEMNRDLLTRAERSQLVALEELFTEEESMDMVKHMPLNASVQAALKQQKYPIALYRSGIPAIEAMIDDYINKYNVPHRVTRAYQALNKIIEQSSNEADLKRQLDMEEREIINLQVEIDKLHQQREKGFGTDAYLERLKVEKRGLSDLQVKISGEAQNKVRAMLKRLESDFERRGNVSKVEAERILSGIRRDTESQYHQMIVDLNQSMKEAQQEIIAELNENYKKYVQDLFAQVDNLKLPILDNFKNKINNLNGNLFELSSGDVKKTSHRVKDGGYYESTSKWWNPFSWGSKKWVDNYKTVHEEKVHLGEYWHKHGVSIRAAFDGNIQAAKIQMEKDSNALLENYIAFMTAQFTPKFDALLQDLEEKVNDREKREFAIQEGKVQLQKIQHVKDELSALLNV